MGIVASIGLCSVLAFASEDRVALHLSFDGTGKATEGWKAGGKGKIHVKAVGSDPSGSASSRHLSIDAEPSTALQTKSIELPDLSRCSDVELRVRSSSATPSEPTVLEVQCFTPNHGWFWRRLDVRAGDEFTTVRLPLRWFRTSRDSVPRWNEVDAFGIWFRNGGTVEIDDIKWIDGGRADAAERSLDEIAAEAFSTATEPKRAEGLRKAIPAMVKARSTALEPHAKAIFGASLDELEAQWMAWATTRYALPQGDDAK